MVSPREALGWLSFSLASAGLAALTWRGPAEVSWPPTPPARARPATPAEIAAVEALGRTASDTLARAAERLGRPLHTDELEGSGPDGAPFLPGGLPDNPLLPGVAGVEEACDARPQDDAGGPIPDWRYCPTQSRLAPNLPPDPP